MPSLSGPGLVDGLWGSNPLETLGKYESVKLFVERARAATPAFELSEQNVRAVAQLCQRLDGIPLAIELAAARTRLLPVEHLLDRVQDQFRLLTGGSRTALPRQQTLRALVDWSYDLLSHPERLLFDRLSVFAGGWTLEAAEAVCAEDGEESRISDQDPTQFLRDGEVLELLGRLVEKSRNSSRSSHSPLWSRRCCTKFPSRRPTVTAQGARPARCASPTKNVRPQTER